LLAHRKWKKKQTKELAGALHGGQSRAPRPKAKQQGKSGVTAAAHTKFLDKISSLEQENTVERKYSWKPRNSGVASRAENRPQREEKSRLGEKQICVKTTSGQEIKDQENGTRVNNH
jgi:hypothetical protein